MGCFYCLECRMPVCSHCLILGDHVDHRQTPIDSAFKTGKETLSAWADQISQCVDAAGEAFGDLHNSMADVDKGAEAQRNVINMEIDHLQELLETKRRQLLSKSLLEENQKLAQVQSQMDRTEAAKEKAMRLLSRSRELLSLRSEHAFLAVVLPLIQDMKKCSTQQFEVLSSVGSYRSFSTDAQVRCLGELDLGVHKPHQANLEQPVLQGQVAVEAQGGFVVPSGYSMAHPTSAVVPYAAPQPPYIQSHIHIPYLYCPTQGQWLLSELGLST